MSLFIYSLVRSFICTSTSVSSLAGKSETLSNASWPKVDKVSSARSRQSHDSFRIFPRTEKRACFQFFTLVFIYARIYLFFSSFICCLNLTSFVIFFLSSLLITSLGHIKLTDFGLSKIGLMNSKYSFFPFVFIVLFRVSRALFGTLLIQSPLYPISVCIFSILFSILLWRCW